MPKILQEPKAPKGSRRKKCRVCKTVAVYYPSDQWTEHGNTEARCANPRCRTVLFLGRLGLPDTY